MKKNTWNIRRLVDESFVPSAQRTSVLYCRLTDFYICICRGQLYLTQFECQTWNSYLEWTLAYVRMQWFCTAEFCVIPKCAESSGKIFPAPGPLTIDKQSQPQAMPRLVFLPFNDSKLLRLESFEQVLCLLFFSKAYGFIKGPQFIKFLRFSGWPPEQFTANEQVQIGIFYSALQMFAGIYKDSAGVFCNICRENPVIFTGFPCNFCNL